MVYCVTDNFVELLIMKRFPPLFWDVFARP